MTIMSRTREEKVCQTENTDKMLSCRCSGKRISVVKNQFAVGIFAVLRFVDMSVNSV